MKLSLLLTAAILAGFACLGWQEHTHLTAAREAHVRLLAEAKELGIDTADLSGKDKAPHVSKLKRDAGIDRDAEAKAFAVDLISFAREMKEMQRKGEQPDEAMQRKIFAIMDRMFHLDAGQMKVLVQEMRDSKDLDDESRRNILGFTLMTMANEHPAEALALYSGSGASRLNSFGMKAALNKLAEKDPMAALEWIRKNSKDDASAINDNTKAAVLSGAARQDPALAFSLIKELGLNRQDSISMIADSATTPAARTSILNAMRDYTKGLSDEREKSEVVAGALSGLSRKCLEAGYDQSIDWLKSANLTPDEAKAFASSINIWWTNSDSGKWVDWMSTTLPEEQVKQKVSEMMGQWTKQDYKAAGTWLNETPDGPVKTSAIASYASTVAPYEPATAAQWAESLPAGGPRDQTLMNVYQEWKKTDPAAADAFAKKNGVEIIDAAPEQQNQ